MRVLLRESVEKLGTIGEIVDVRDGYGRNYLLPRGIAVPVTTENIRRLELRKQELLAEEARRKATAESLATALKDESVTIPMKAQKAEAGGEAEEGKLYGSVTAQMIADAFVIKGYAVEARMVLLDQPIKALGVYEVRLRLHPGTEATAKVWVVEAE
jgi:large subunit ribosomal protein L9